MAAQDDREDKNDGPDLGRRRMLAKLGLAAGAIYTAPVLLQIGQAKASGGSGSGGRGSRGSRGSGGSR